MNLREAIKYVRAFADSGSDTFRQSDQRKAMAIVADAAERSEQLERAAQEVMQWLGPEVPADVDYTDPGNIAGLTTEIEQALIALRCAGIVYQSRKRAQ